MKSHAWLKIGAGAAVICSFDNVISLMFDSKYQISLFSLIYVCSLMIIPFALWYRIGKKSRKWKARICNGLTMLTAVFTVLADIHATPITAHTPEWSGMALIIAVSGCMAYMGWVLWDGGSKWLGLGALTLAALSWTHFADFFEFLPKGIWFLLLAYWLLQPIHMFSRKQSF